MVNKDEIKKLKENLEKGKRVNSTDLEEMLEKESENFKE